MKSKKIIRPHKKWFSESEAAMYMGISVSFLRNLRANREIEYRVFTDGKKILYDVDCLDEAVARLFKTYKTTV